MKSSDFSDTKDSEKTFLGMKLFYVSLYSLVRGSIRYYVYKIQSGIGKGENRKGSCS